MLDDFNRADSTGLGANWSSDPAFFSSSLPDIVSNAAKAPLGGASKFKTAYWNPDGFGNDCFVQFKIGAGTTPAATLYIIGLMTASIATSSCKGYEADIVANGSTAQGYDIYRYDSSSSSPVISGGGTTQRWNVGDIVRLALVGSNVILYRSTDGGVTFTIIQSVSDNTYRSTATHAYFGMEDGSVASAIGIVDDFDAGNWGPITKPKISLQAVGRMAVR